MGGREGGREEGMEDSREVGGREADIMKKLGLVCIHIKT